MLTRLYVDNFRCLVNFECRFGPRQLILGPNGAGKSTIFDLLALVRQTCILGGNLEQRSWAHGFGPGSRTRWLDVPEQQVELDVQGNGGAYHFRLVVDTVGAQERPRIVHETVAFDGQPIFRFELGEVHLYNDRAEHKVQYPFDWHRSALATVSERPENSRLTWFKQWLGGLLYLQPNPWAMSGLATEETDYPERDLSNFAAWYRHLVQSQVAKTQAFFADLSQLIEGFSELRLVSAGEARRELELRLDQMGGKVGPAAYAFPELSEGQRVLIGLYAVLHFALAPEVTVCIDEPDNFVALRELQPWLASVLERTEEAGSSAQVLLVSHHPELLNELALTDGLVVDRPDGRHSRIRKFSEHALEGLTPAELVARGWER